LPFKSTQYTSQSGSGEPVLLNNSANPRLTVAAVAKRKILRNEILERGAEGFDVRGIAVQLHDNLDAAPIGLLKNIKVLRDIEPSQIVHFEDVELAETKALEIYHTMAKEV